MKNFVRFLKQESKLLPEEWSVMDMMSWLKDQFTVIEGKAEDHKRPRDSWPLLTGNRSTDRHHYNYSAMNMALLSAHNRVVTKPTHCRDYLNEAIRWHVWRGRGLHSHHCDSEGMPGHMDTKSLRILILLDGPMVAGLPVFDGISNGLRLANMYGRVAGWGPVHVGHALLPLEDSEPRECYVLTGDGNWQRTPQYISMLMLLIRICLVYKVPDWITDAYALTGWWNEFLYHRDPKDSHISLNSDVIDFLLDSYQHMLVMMAHDWDIFPHDMRGGYPRKGDGFHAASGLNSLVHSNSFHPESAKKLRTYYVEEVVKYGRGKD